MDLAIAPCRAPLTARKMGSGYENATGYVMSVYESCDTVLDRCDAFPMRDEIGNI
jgi:hypothetical protein